MGEQNEIEVVDQAENAADQCEDTVESETKKVIQELHAKIERLEAKIKAEVEAVYGLLTRHGIHHAPQLEAVADVPEASGDVGSTDKVETKAAE